MPLMGHAHGTLSAPFADLHVEDGVVRATLLHDPVVDGVDMAIYVDGSQSMSEEFEYRDDLPSHDDRHGHDAPAAALGAAMIDTPSLVPPAPKGAKQGWLARLFGWFKPDDPDVAHDDHEDEEDDEAEDDHGHATSPTHRARTNMVEPQVRRMLQYLATKDRNGKLRLAYWACGPSGRHIELVGEMSAADAESLQVPGPKDPGSGTCLVPALKDFVAYMEREARKGAKRGCGVFVTDGQIADQGGVFQLSREIAARVAKGSLPPLHLVLVGVGDQVNEKQLEEISHVEVPGAEHLWCHRVAEEMHEMAELVSGLVDGTMTVASGGTVYDARGQVVRRYEHRLPAVLEFELPKGQTRFTLEIEGRRYTQDLPAEGR